MSSPIRHANDLDAALRYAPPWVRNESRPMPTPASAPPLDQPPRRQRFDDSRTFSGDRAVADGQRRLALDPDSVPEPPPAFADDRTPWRIVLPVCGAAGIAAVIAWAIVSVPNARPTGRETARADLAAPPISTRVATPHRLRTATATPADRPDRQMSGSGEVVPEPGKRAPLGERAAGDVTMGDRAPPIIAPEPPAAEPTGPSLITRRLDREEVASLVRRGEDFITSGDIASARLVLRRAAEAGDVRAALTLAGTFDTNLLANLGMEGVADAAMARLWYERAEQFGSVEASRRLEQLATKAP